MGGGGVLQQFCVIWGTFGERFELGDVLQIFVV